MRSEARYFSPGRTIGAVILLAAIACGASGCYEGYGYGGGYPAYGYAPYSYGWGGGWGNGWGYNPVFVVHHPWEGGHYGYGGHHTEFYHGGGAGVGHEGGGGGHGGGGHR